MLCQIFFFSFLSLLKKKNFFLLLTSRFSESIGKWNEFATRTTTFEIESRSNVLDHHARRNETLHEIFCHCASKRQRGERCCSARRRQNSAQDHWTAFLENCTFQVATRNGFSSVPLIALHRSFLGKRNSEYISFRNYAFKNYVESFSSRSTKRNYKTKTEMLKW